MAGVADSMTVDRTSPVPLYFQVAQELQRLIEAGDIPAGSRLDNEIRLADDLGVSRPTMRRAIEFLVERGLLARKRGVGTQVVRAQVRRPLKLTSLYDDLVDSGRRPRTDVLAFEVVTAEDEIATALGVPVGSDVRHLKRLRFADAEPIAVMTNYLPLGLLVDAAAEDLRQRGLYEMMRSAGVHIHLADQTIGARAATADEARLLLEPRDTALLTMTRTAYDVDGRSVEYGKHAYSGSRYSFSLTLVERA
jgi:DNA-binding GntR family transcriptional regulator